MLQFLTGTCLMHSAGCAQTFPDMQTHMHTHTHAHTNNSLDSPRLHISCMVPLPVLSMLPCLPNSSLNRVLEPFLLMEMTLSNGTVRSFEVGTAQCEKAAHLAAGTESTQ